MGCANDDPLNESGACTIKAGTENNKQNWTDTAGKNAGILAIVTGILSRMSKACGYSREKELHSESVPHTGFEGLHERFRKEQK